MRLLALLAVTVLAGACGSAPTGGAPLTAGPTPTAQASPSLTPLACTASGPASTSWTPPSARTSMTPPILSAVAAGDTLTLTFDQGTPDFELKPQSSAHFIETSGRGAPVDVAGTAGVEIILKGFRGDVGNYAGPTSIKSGGPLLLEVRAIGEFEGVVGWAAGLSKPGCANVTAAGSTLTFRFTATAN